MAGTWKCDRCSTANDERGIRCSNCGLMRGSVVVAGTPDAAPATANATSDPADPTAAASDPAPDSDEPVAGWTAPAPTPLWRRVPIGWAIFLVLIVAGGIGGAIFNAARDSSGEIVKQGDLTVSDLRVGDCYDLKDATADEVENVTAIPCTSEHTYEMFFVGPMSGTTYPTDAQFEDFLVSDCIAAFDAFVGRAYADSLLEMHWFTPTRSGWATGDRTIQCAAYDPAIERLTTSLRGSNR